MRPFRWNSSILLLGLLLSALLPMQRASSQVVTGEVREAFTEQPVVGGEVFLIEIDRAKLVRQTSTDAAGRFRLVPPVPGDYLLYVRRLGYADVRSDPLHLEAGDTVRVGVQMLPEAVELDSVTVTAERRAPHLARVGFYERRKQGWGEYITREDFERRAVAYPSDLFHELPGVSLSPGRRGPRITSNRTFGTECEAMALIVDGMMVEQDQEEFTIDDLVSISDIEAIEVYPSAAGVPVQFGGMRAPCGAILIWTRW